MKAEEWLKPILTERSPLYPVPTGIEPRLDQIAGIKAVIFDVYGTLVVSGSGDVGSIDHTDRSSVIRRACDRLNISESVDGPISWQDLRSAIDQMNAERKSSNCVSPEIDVISVWRELLDQKGLQFSTPATSQVVRLATYFEAWANPTWPMPAACDAVHQLSSRGFCLGIVSNAQIFTNLLVEDLEFSKKNGTSVFQSDLSFFSNRFRHSKPGPRLFDALSNALRRRNILPQEAVYVGNDMLNDVWAAKQIGMKTAWFVGDRRSARERSGDSRCAKLSPDLVITSLPQLLECLTLK